MLCELSMRNHLTLKNISGPEIHPLATPLMIMSVKLMILGGYLIIQLMGHC